MSLASGEALKAAHSCSDDCCWLSSQRTRHSTSELDPTRASYPTEQHVGQAAPKITSCNGMENIPNQGCIPGKMPALTQISLVFMNSHG